MSSRLAKLWDKFRKKDFREAFSNESIATGISAQIQTMREDRNLTQSELAHQSGMTQSRISLLEDPSYDRASISTLKRIAAACDVALIVRFVPFSEMLKDTATPNDTKYSVVSFDDDALPGMPFSTLPSSRWIAHAQVRASGASTSLIVIPERSKLPATPPLVPGSVASGGTYAFA